MNMNQNPTPAQLADLLRPIDDDADHHVLWVDTKGAVKIGTEQDFQATPRDTIRFYYEAYGKGNEYTGPKAAADTEWVTQLFEELKKDWASGETGFLDS